MVIRREPGCNLFKAIALFEAGRDKEWKRALCQSVASMMKKATRNKANLKLQRMVDRYGATIEIFSTPLFIHAELNCLSSYAGPMMDIFFEILFEAEFKEGDWKIVKKISEEMIRQNAYQTDYSAEKNLYESLMGRDGILGYYSCVDDYAVLNIEDIREYYKQNIQGSAPVWFISGDVNASIEYDILQKVKAYSLKPSIRRLESYPHNPPAAIRQKIEGANQASVRLGTIIPRNSFEDFLEIEVLSCFLGGYYLSQLMRILRIEKGYTYGVYSHAAHFPFYSIVTISYEADPSYIDSSIDEIKQLFDRLKVKGKIDLRETLAQYHSQWSKQSERSLLEILYELKLYKLGYSYETYRKKIENYQKIKIDNLSDYNSTLFNFDSYTKSIAL